MFIFSHYGVLLQLILARFHAHAANGITSAKAAEMRLGIDSSLSMSSSNLQKSEVRPVPSRSETQSARRYKRKKSPQAPLGFLIRTGALD